MDYHLFNSHEEKPKIDLDSKLSRLYLYYHHGGLVPMIVKEISNLFVYAFVVILSMIMLSFVDYSCIFGVKETTPLSQCFHWGARQVPVFVWIIVIIMAIFWCLNLIQFLIDLPELIKIKNFYLHIGITDIVGTSWNDIAEKIQSELITEQLDINTLGIASRIMRKDNYIIAMFNRDLFGLKSNLYYTKVVEWALEFSVWNYLFGNNTIKPEIINAVDLETLEKDLKLRIRVCGLIFCLLSPIIFIFLIIYYACFYFDQIKNSPSFLGGRMWTRYASWKFREFNELQHFYHYRFEKGRSAAEAYVKSFPSPVLTTLAYLVGFLVASMLMIIGLFGMIEDDTLTKITIFGRPLLYVAGILGLILTVTSTSGKRTSQFETKAHLDELIEQTHYKPVGYKNPAAKETYNDIVSLYQYRIVVFLISILGIFIGPFWLLFVLPHRARQILQFVQTFTVEDPNVGHVCVFSIFKDGLNESQLVKSSHESDRSKLQESMVTFRKNHIQDQV